MGETSILSIMKGPQNVKEDCIKYSIDKQYPTRSLNSEEEAFLSALANYTLFLDRALFFQMID